MRQSKEHGRSVIQPFVPYRIPAPKRTKVLRHCLDVLAKHCPCPEPWDAMDGGECQRTCPRCAAAVFDVHAMEPSEAEAFLAERMAHPPFVDAWVRDDGRVMLASCPAGLRRRALRRVAIAFAIAGAVSVLSIMLR